MLCENIQISWLRWLIDNDHLRVNCVWGCCQRGKSIYLWKEDLIFILFSIRSWKDEILYIAFNIGVHLHLTTNRSGTGGVDFYCLVVVCWWLASSSSYVTGLIVESVTVSLFVFLYLLSFILEIVQLVHIVLICDEQAWLNRDNWSGLNFCKNSSLIILN